MTYLKSIWTFLQKYAVYILAVVLLFFALECQRSGQEKNRHEDNLKALKSEITYTKSKLGQEVATKQALEVTNKELTDQLWIKDDSLQDLVRKYRKVNVAAIIETKTFIPSFQAGFETSIPGEAFIRKWKKADPWYSISGIVTNDFVRVDTLQMNNTQRLVIGTEKGFFSNTLSASVTNSNPYIQTTDLTTQVIQQRNKRFGIGVISGFNIVGQPIFGVGVSYSFLQF